MTKSRNELTTVKSNVIVSFIRDYKDNKKNLINNNFIDLIILKIQSKSHSHFHFSQYWLNNNTVRHYL